MLTKKIVSRNFVTTKLVSSDFNKITSKSSTVNPLQNEENNIKSVTVNTTTIIVVVIVSCIFISIAVTIVICWLRRKKANQVKDYKLKSNVNNTLDSMHEAAHTNSDDNLICTSKEVSSLNQPLKNQQVNSDISSVSKYENVAQSTSNAAISQNINNISDQVNSDG